MKTECCTSNCEHGERCVFSAASVRDRCLKYGICGIAACLLVVIISASQALEDYDDQAAQSQVMACSEHRAYCKAWAEAHASAPANRR